MARINLKWLSHDIHRWRGKSGDGKTSGIDKTSKIGGCAIEEKEESSKKVTSVEMK